MEEAKAGARRARRACFVVGRRHAVLGGFEETDAAPSPSSHTVPNRDAPPLKAYQRQGFYPLWRRKHLPMEALSFRGDRGDGGGVEGMEFGRGTDDGRVG